MKQLTIKSSRGLSMVSKVLETKLRNKVAIFEDYEVKNQEWLKGIINRIVIRSKYHMLTKSVIDYVWEVIDEYEAKYDTHCICATIQTAPYLTNDGSDWLHEPTIEITLRVKEA